MHFYYRLIIIGIVCLFASACKASLSDTSSSSSTPNTKTEDVVVSTNIETVPEKFTISSQGIGDAQIGMTYGELKSKLDKSFELRIESPFMVDLDAIAVYDGEQLQYYILYLSGSTFQDTDIIEVLMTDNPKYLTSEGIGVGTSVKEVEKIYGKASLSYNTYNESREYITFAKQPFSNIYFRPLADNHDFAGIYKKPVQEYNQTDIFQDSATIRLIEVMKN